MTVSSRAPIGYRVDGLIERVTFFSEESGFCVLRVKTEGYRDFGYGCGLGGERFNRRMGHR
jgi:hypothetical protein